MNEEYQNELKTEIEMLKDMHEKDQYYIASQKELIIALERVHEVQRYSLNGSYDDYNQGLYNGLELALSIMFEKEPVYAQPCEKETHISIDGKEVAKNIRKHAYTGL
ncbi:MAG: hypothetical protein ACLTDX_14335 [[Clostridium] innocuum]